MKKEISTTRMQEAVIVMVPEMSRRSIDRADISGTIPITVSPVLVVLMRVLVVLDFHIYFTLFMVRENVII